MWSQDNRRHLDPLREVKQTEQGYVDFANCDDFEDVSCLSSRAFRLKGFGCEILGLVEYDGPGILE